MFKKIRRRNGFGLIRASETSYLKWRKNKLLSEKFQVRHNQRYCQSFAFIQTRDF